MFGATSLSASMSRSRDGLRHLPSEASGISTQAVSDSACCASGSSPTTVKRTHPSCLVNAGGIRREAGDKMLPQQAVPSSGDRKCPRGAHTWDPEAHVLSARPRGSPAPAVQV